MSLSLVTPSHDWAPLRQPPSRHLDVGEFRLGETRGEASPRLSWLLHNTPSSWPWAGNKHSSPSQLANKPRHQPTRHQQRTTLATTPARLSLSIHPFPPMIPEGPIHHELPVRTNEAGSTGSASPTLPLTPPESQISVVPSPRTTQSVVSHSQALLRSVMHASARHQQIGFFYTPPQQA